jgi:sugar phosphate isomerase/epimerase
MTKRPFGVSTRLYERQRLGRDQLLEIAAHGFEAVELLAARAHLDYQNPAAVADLQQWLAEAGLELASVHVPADEDADAALLIARRLPLKLLVLRATTPRDTAKMVDRLAGAAAPLGVALAIDSTSMTPIGSLVHFVESGVDVPIGICLDFSAAAVGGGLVDTLEEVAEHLVLVRLPVESAIDWASAMTTAQKIGYEGPLIFDADARGSSKETLTRAKETRRRVERLLAI